MIALLIVYGVLMTPGAALSLLFYIGKFPLFSLRHQSCLAAFPPAATRFRLGRGAAFIAVATPGRLRRV